MLIRSLGRRSLIALAIVSVAVLVYSVFRGATWTSDFKNPYRVARIFWESGALDIRSEPRYPPTIRVLMAPLAALPIAVAAAIWAALSLAAMAVLPDAIKRLSDLSLREQALPWLAVLTFILDAFALGQSDPINLFLVTFGLAAARASRPVAGAALIGLAGMIKVLPVVFWGVLVARRRVAAAVAGVVMTVAASLILLTAFAGWGPGLHSVGGVDRGLARAGGTLGTCDHAGLLAPREQRGPPCRAGAHVRRPRPEPDAQRRVPCSPAVAGDLGNLGGGPRRHDADVGRLCAGRAPCVVGASLAWHVRAHRGRDARWRVPSPGLTTSCGCCPQRSSSRAARASSSPWRSSASSG